MALVARTQARLDAIVRDLGEGALAVAGDVVDAASLSAAIEVAEVRLGPIDIAVNNAGGIATTDGALFRPFEAVSDEDWLSTFELSVMSAVRVSRALAPKMAARGWGRIINISSENGVQPDPVAVEYSAAKGALNAMTKALSKAYGDRGVLVNTVSPAFVDTPVVRGVLSQMPGASEIAPDQLAQHHLKDFRPNIVLGRAGRPDEVAAAVVFPRLGRGLVHHRRQPPRRWRLGGDGLSHASEPASWDERTASGRPRARSCWEGDSWKAMSRSRETGRRDQAVGRQGERTADLRAGRVYVGADDGHRPFASGDWFSPSPAELDGAARYIG